VQPPAPREHRVPDTKAGCPTGRARRGLAPDSSQGGQLTELIRTAGLQHLREDSGVALLRRPGGADGGAPSLILLPVTSDPDAGRGDHLAREFDLRDRLDPAWALMPRSLTRVGDAPALELEDPGGVCLVDLLGAPLETGRFLALAAGIAEALGRIHRAGLIHKDVKPANILVDCSDGRVRFTGFAMASSLQIAGQTAEPPEMIAGTLAFMAPEQTGRTNRPVDARSDLYALGVTLYLMATGTMPFAASDPMELVHLHIARRPDAPRDREGSVHPVISAMIMKLLEKAPEDRYQTAAGLLHDLHRCLDAWTTEQQIPTFALGARDVPDRLLIPDRLYGRERESATIRDCLERVANGGVAELVLVSGYSGVGKSTLVNDLQKAMGSSGGLFASGKFDQHQRDVPYATLVQALEALVRYVLARSDAELAGWRKAFGDALGTNGRLVTELVPELELVIGEQPPVPELPLQQAQVRFRLTLQRFIGVFARPEHPLVLFLDDLQWLDLATLELIGELLTDADLKHLLLVGAYRDNETAAEHPLHRRLAEMRASGARLTEIALPPLSREHLTEMISDTLRCPAAEAVPLAALVREKTDGNPFFVRQFLSLLVDESVLVFDHDRGAWSWDVGHIRAQRFTDNVAELMIGKLARLPRDTLTALQNLACLGNFAHTATLSLVLGTDSEQVDAALEVARALDLVETVREGYRFSHDRVQEAAYASIPSDMRGPEHLRIGRLLAARVPELGHDETVFDVPNQLNRAAGLITSPAERESLAEHNLAAGLRAQASAAYASALNYFASGVALLTEDSWRSRGELAFSLTFHLAECEFVAGRAAEAERRLSALQQRAETASQGAAVTRLRSEILVTLGNNDQAIEIALEFLARIGIRWTAHPSADEVRAEYDELRRNLREKPVETWRDLPPMTDPEALAAMEVLLQLAPASALATDGNLLCACVCRMANLTYAHGSSEGSPSAFVWLGVVLGAHLGDYQSGYRFARLGLDLVEERGLERFRLRANMLFAAHVNPWSQPFSAGRPMLERAFSEANELGDITFASYCCSNLVTLLLVTGEELGAAQDQAEFRLQFVRDHQFGFVADLITPSLQLIRCLRGKLPIFGRLDGDDFAEEEFAKRLEHHPIAQCWYWVRKLQARFLAGDYAAAADAASKAETLLWTSVYMVEFAEYHFYAALARAACFDHVGETERSTLRRLLAEHAGQLRRWAENAPANFEDRATLVEAEIARIEGRTLEAMDLYERAIRSATEHGFLHQRAIANELAGRFHAGRGFETIGRAYLREARDCYHRWGAAGKVSQLDRLAPPSRLDRSAPDATGTVTSPVDSLDFATIIRVSQKISGETATDRLVDTLMRTALENAGADKAVLLIMDGEAARIEAEAIIEPAGVVVRSSRRMTLDVDLPESVLHYAGRSRDSVILRDALEPNMFSGDPFFGANNVRSLLCVPLLNSNRLIGLLYLENRLAPGVFTNERVAVLKLIALRAAISLENARLYSDIEERESRIRRLVEAGVIGIVIWATDGRLIDANDTFLSMIQCDRADLEAGLNWFEMIPPGSKEAYLREEAEELKATGMLRAREREVFRKDGTPIPVLIGGATFESNPDEGVAYILDLTELKRAEAEARENERRYRAVQSELAHANRTSTLGQLTGSIAHEVNQPITASVINAQAALRALRSSPPDLAEVEDALESIVKDGNRASEIIARIRGLIKKKPAVIESLAINDPIAGIIELIRGEAKRHGVAVRLDLEDDLPPVEGDRVQLQQVLLNLVMNAIEAMDEDCEERELCIATSKSDEGSVVVSVQDTGPGLDPALGDEVFDAFCTTKASGLGMGLSICRSIVEAHGGRIWAVANEPRGARFFFTLPASTELAST
jgi:PAS domain S-box-containing protein